MHGVLQSYSRVLQAEVAYQFFLWDNDASRMRPVFFECSIKLAQEGAAGYEQYFRLLLG